MGTKMTMPGMLLLIVEVIALAVLGVASASHFGLADGLSITVSYLVAYLVPLLLLKRARGTSAAAHVVLLLIALFMGFVAWDCLVEWARPEGCSLQRPNLSGDARSLYKWALHEYDGSAEYDGGIFPGFPLMMVAMWKVLGVSVIWPQAINMMFTMVSVVLTGMMTRRVLSRRIPLSDSSLVLCGMLLMCPLLYYLASGVTILKEATTFLSVTMVGYALSSMVAGDDERHRLGRDIVIFLVACLLLAFVRTTFLYSVALGVILIALPHLRRDWLLALCLLAAIAVMMFLGNHFAGYSFYRHAEIVDGGWNMQRSFNHSYNLNIIGFYFLYSPLHRVLLLPVTMAVQFFLPMPVPWILVDEEPYWLAFFSRMSYGWYLFGGTALFYCLFMSWRRHFNIGLWAWWPVIVYVGLAYVMGGTMARYVLPFQPLMVPMVLFTLYLVFTQRRWRKAYLVYLLVLVLLVLGGLLLNHEVSWLTISKLLKSHSLFL